MKEDKPNIIRFYVYYDGDLKIISGNRCDHAILKSRSGYLGNYNTYNRAVLKTKQILKSGIRYNEMLLKKLSFIEHLGLNRSE